MSYSVNNKVTVEMVKTFEIFDLPHEAPRKFIEWSNLEAKSCTERCKHQCKITLKDTQSKIIQLKGLEIGALTQWLPKGLSQIIGNVITYGDLRWNLERRRDRMFNNSSLPLFDPFVFRYLDPDQTLTDIFTDQHMSRVERPPIPENGKFPKIALKTLEKVRNFFCIVFTLGIILLVQQYRFRKGLENGNLEQAKGALRWGISAYLSQEHILNLLKTNKLESIEFLVSQIKFNPNSPEGGSPAANEFLSARDDQEGGKTREALVKILPFKDFPRTYLCRGSCETYFRSFCPRESEEIDTHRVYKESN